MPKGKIDIIEGSRVVERGGQILEVDRIAWVNGLTGNEVTLKQALDGVGFTGSAMPMSGSVHPSIVDLVLEDRVSEPTGPFSAKVTLTYRWNPTILTLIDAGSGVEAVVTELDSPDKEIAQPIVLTHPGLPKDSTGERRQGAQVNVTSARPFAIAQVTLPLTGGESQAIRHIKRFNNTVNSKAFLGTGTERQWLVTDATYTAVARDNGSLTRARFTFTFQNKPEEWQPIKIVAIRPLDGLPFPDAGSANAPDARKDLNWYEEVDFIGMQTITS